MWWARHMIPARGLYEEEKRPEEPLDFLTKALGCRGQAEWKAKQKECDELRSRVTTLEETARIDPEDGKVYGEQ
eukprot:gene5080-3318_t